MSTNSTPENPPAFPEISSHSASDEYGNRYMGIESIGGMTLRDHFAGQAMHGMFAGGMVEKANQAGIDAETNERAVAQSAYLMADAMLLERAKTQ